MACYSLASRFPVPQYETTIFLSIVLLTIFILEPDACLQTIFTFRFLVFLSTSFISLNQKGSLNAYVSEFI